MNTVGNKYDWFAEYDEKQAQLDLALGRLRAVSAAIAKAVQEVPVDRRHLEVLREQNYFWTDQVGALLTATSAILDSHRESW